MSTVLHILVKDLRRLWPLVLAALLPLAALGWFDTQRYDYYPGVQETVLNMLLPLGWAVLLALATQDDGPAGGDHYAATRPIPLYRSLAAKLLFAGLAIHLPFLLEQAAVLAAHGFSSASYVAPLLRNQLLLFAGLTLPAVALAAVTRNLTHFVLAVCAVVAGALALTLPSREFSLPWVQGDAFRRSSAWVVGSIAAAVATGLAFMKQVSAARAAAVSGAVAAGLVYAFLPVEIEARLQAMLRPDPVLQNVQLRYTPTVQFPPLPGSPYPNVRTVAIPFAAPGLPKGRSYSTRMLLSDIRDAEGRALNLRLPERDYLTQLAVFEEMAWQLFHVRETHAPGSTATANVKARAIVSSLVPAGQLRMRAAAGTIASHDDLGCRTSNVPNVWGPQAGLKVVCESPEHDLALSLVSISGPGLPQPVDQRLNASVEVSRGPQLTWLPPLYRGHTFFPLVRTQTVYDRWNLPADAAQTATVTIQTLRIPGYAILEYSAKNVRIDQYLVPPPAQRAGRR